MKNFLLIALMLAGCTVQPPEQATSTATSTAVNVAKPASGVVKLSPKECEALLKAHPECPQPGSGWRVVDLATYVDEKLADVLACGGVEGIVRYYDWPGQETLRGKMPTDAEMKTLAKRKFKHARVFQHNNSSINSFTKERGEKDAGLSVSQAVKAGAVKGNTIYFGVDGDFSGSDTKKIMAYFQAATPIVRAAGFRVGMYGSGSNCKMLKSAGLVDKDMCHIAASSWGWSGTKLIIAEAKGYALHQNVNKKCMGKSMDFNKVLVEDYGQWQL